MIPDPPTVARPRGIRSACLLALFPALALLLATAACERASPQHDLLLVTIDTLRVDHVSAYGYARSPATPAFDRIASGGVLFEQAVAPAPLTLPSHASLLTGQRPFRHGVRDNGGFRLRSSIPTLAEVLKARGYRTAAFVGAFVLDSRFGLDRGFEVYGDDMGKALPPQRGGYLGDVRRDGRAVADAAAAWITGAGPGPIFIWAHLYDPHAPYEAEAVYRDRYPGRAYAAAVAQADAALGRILEAFERRPASPSAVVAIAGDHGESLGEHGEPTHGVFLYDATLRVPLALRGPGLEPGTRIPWQVRLIDLAPTLLGLAGASPHSGNRSRPALAADGIDLCPALRGEAPAPRLAAYAESLFGTYHYGWSPLRALREGGFKWIEAPRPELYDLGRDPGETENLWSHEPSRTAEMSERLALIAGSQSVEPPPGPEDAETLARLRALGYVGAGMSDRRQAPRSTAGPRAAHLPDPKDGIHRHARFEQGFREAAVRFDAGEYGPAHQRASRLLNEFPEARDARRLRALAALNLGHEEEARSDFEQLLEQDPGDIEALIGMGRLLERQGQRPQALALYRRALASGPEQPGLLLRAARLMRLDGNLDEADAQLRRVLELDPTLAAAAFERGLVRLARGAAGEAESFFRQAVRIDSGLRGVHHNLALLREQAGDPTGARREYEEELRHHPGSYASHLNLGLLLGRQAEHDSALRHLEAAVRAAPRQPRALTALAAALLRRRGKEARAKALLEKALQVDPGYTPALSLLEKLPR